jgi:hypothetical protein
MAVNRPQAASRLLAGKINQISLHRRCSFALLERRFFRIEYT